MQHYGGKTPILDFTENKYVALHFACELITNPVQTDIDNYFSVYKIEKRKVNHTVNYFYRLIEKFHFDHDKIIDQLKKAFPHSDLSLEELESVLEKSQKDELSVIPLFNGWKAGLIADTDHSTLAAFGTKSNLNILVQKGVFMFNYHPTQTLDESMSEYLKETAMKAGHSEYGAKAILRANKPIKCYDIHKILAPKIREYLDNTKIDNTTLFPNINSIVKLSEQNIIKNMLN